MSAWVIWDEVCKRDTDRKGGVSVCVCLCEKVCVPVCFIYKKHICNILVTRRDGVALSLFVVNNMCAHMWYMSLARGLFFFRVTSGECAWRVMWCACNPFFVVVVVHVYGACEFVVKHIWAAFCSWVSFSFSLFITRIGWPCHGVRGSAGFSFILYQRCIHVRV